MGKFVINVVNFVINVVTINFAVTIVSSVSVIGHRAFLSVNDEKEL